jgi:hypothetical protein
MLSFSFFGPPPSGTVLPGSHQAFYLDLENNGLASATNVKALFKLPEGYTFNEATLYFGDSTYDAATGIWNIGSLSAFDIRVLAIDAIVNATGSLRPTAMIAGSSQPDPDLTNNVATASQQTAGGTPALTCVSANSTVNSTVGSVTRTAIPLPSAGTSHCIPQTAPPR